VSINALCSKGDALYDGECGWLVCVLVVDAPLLGIPRGIMLLCFLVDSSE
jgi:hypothetical protein